MLYIVRDMMLYNYAWTSIIKEITFVEICYATDMEDKFDKREMTDSDFDFYPGNWKNPLGYTHSCFWNHQNPLFGPQNSPLKF